MDLTSINLNQYKTLEKPKKRIFRWQELATQINHDLKVPFNMQKVVFKICYENPEDYVEHCFNETKELAKENKVLYFIKLVNK